MKSGDERYSELRAEVVCAFYHGQLLKRQQKYFTVA